MPTTTVTITATLPVNLTGEANPGDSHLPLGRWDPGTGLAWATRLLLKASFAFGGMSGINEARLYLRAHSGSGWHAKGAGTATIHARRKTADWSEASGGATGTDETWGGSYAALVTGSLAAVETGDFANLGALTDGAWYYIPVTQIVRRWFEGQPNYGIELLNVTSETDATKAKEFYSRRVTGYVPYLYIDYASNVAPNAPTGLTPTGDALVHTGRTIPLTMTRDDPDAGDYITAHQVELATDALAVILDTGAVADAGTPATISPSITLPAGSDAGAAYYRWRGKTRDKSSAWGPYSAWQRFRPNSPPTTPAAPTLDGSLLTPTIGGGYGDPDPAAPGATKAGHQVQVELGAAPNTLLWDSGMVASAAAPWSIPYGGPALVLGTSYRARYRVADALDGVSAWGPFVSWTPTTPVGPDNLTPRSTTAKLNTLTPTLTVGHSAQFRNDEYEVYAGNDLASVRLQAKVWAGADYGAAFAKAYVYAGTALAWGGTYYWRARAELLDGTVTAWSALVPFRLNALPTAPVLTVTNTDGTPAATASGVQVVTVARPTLTAPFADPDVATDGDVPSARSIEVKRKDTGAALAGYPVTAGTSGTHPLTADLTAEVVYQARWGWRDNVGQPAGGYSYSAWLEIRRSSAPAIAAVGPGAAVTDSTPVLDWSLTPAAGKAQATWQALVFDLGPVGALYPGGEVPVHDSGVRLGTATDYELPAGLILNGHRYRWEIRATDSDGLTARLT